MNAEKYFSVENGREVMLGKLYDLKAAIGFAEKNTEAKEIFAYTQEDELIGCVWNRERDSCSNKIIRGAEWKIKKPESRRKKFSSRRDLRWTAQEGLWSAIHPTLKNFQGRG